MKLSITGMGIVSPAGIGKEEFYASLTRGKTGIVSYEQSPFINRAGVIKDFSVKQFTKNFKQARPLAKASHFAIAASKMASEDARFSSFETKPHNTGVISGTYHQYDESNTLPFINAYDYSLNEKGEIDFIKFANKGIRELPAKLLLQISPNTLTFTCSYELSVNGYTNTITSGGNSFFDSLIEADIAIRRKMADTIFCGAADSLLNPQDIISLVPLGAKQVENFNIIPGEGSVFFLLEDSEGARIKNCKVYAEVLSCTGTLFHNFKDIETNIKNALHQANLPPDDIDVIVGSQEAKAFYSKPVLESIAKCFKKKADVIPISSPIPYVGYTRAVAGAFDLALAVFILETGKAPPMLQPVETYSCKPLLCDEGACIENDFRTVLVISIGLTGCVYSAIIRKQDK